MNESANQMCALHMPESTAGDAPTALSTRRIAFWYAHDHFPEAPTPRPRHAPLPCTSHRPNPTPSLHPFPPAQIMTTNQPEQLDPTMVAALIRPGRIDK